MGELELGVVGAGFVAREIHGPTWMQGIRGVDVKVRGITAFDKNAAERLGDEHGIPVYDTLDEMIARTDIDVVDVCVPDYAHEDVVVQAAKAGKHVICEKLMTGHFGTDEDVEAAISAVYGSSDPEERKRRIAGLPTIGFAMDRALSLKQAMQSCDRIEQAVKDAGVELMYAENWVFAPAIVKLSELLSAHPQTKILYMEGEESHSGSGSPAYGFWALHGSGSTSGKLCHPIGPALRLKYEEGIRVTGRPFRPVKVIAQTTHNWRDIPHYEEHVEDKIRTDYHDVEDGVYAMITFSDRSTALVKSNEYSVGGVLNTFRVDASNQRHLINLAPNLNMDSYAGDETVFGEEYITEKVKHRGGHQHPAPNELYDLGYEAEFEAFARHLALGEPLPVDTAMLARDTVAICYGALLSAQQDGKAVDLTPYLS